MHTVEEPPQDVRYFYFRDDRRRPVITLCRIIAHDGKIGYGWAICGPRDNPHKRDVLMYDKTTESWKRIRGGKSVAYGRAEAALKRGEPCKGCDGTVFTYGRKVSRMNAMLAVYESGEKGFQALVYQHDPWQLPRLMRPPVNETIHDVRGDDGQV